MREKRLPPDDSQEWLNRARSNLIRARSEAAGVYIEDLCFDTQQAAEKAVKAVLVHSGLPFPHVHDLASLLTLVEKSGCKVSASVKQAAGLARFAVLAPHPGLDEPVSREEYEDPVRLAEAVVRWAEDIVVTQPWASKPERFGAEHCRE